MLWHKGFGAAFRDQDINQDKMDSLCRDNEEMWDVLKKNGGLRSPCWLDKLSDTNLMVFVLGKPLVALLILAGGFSRHLRA